MRAAPEWRASKTRIHIMSEWSSHITAQKCTVQLRRLVRMPFLCQPIIPPRMVAMGFPLRRCESLVLCGRTESANAITVALGDKSGRFDAAASCLRKKWRGRSILRIETQSQLQSPLRIVDNLRRASATADSSCGEFARFKLGAHFF